MSDFRSILTTLLFTFSSISAYSQSIDLSKKTQIDSIVMRIMTENKIVGLSIGIVKNNIIYYSQGYGSKEIDQVAPIDSFTNKTLV